jgi:hypothetical protein
MVTMHYFPWNQETRATFVNDFFLSFYWMPVLGYDHTAEQLGKGEKKTFKKLMRFQGKRAD